MAQTERLELVEAMWETHESPAAWLGSLSEAFERAVPELLAPTAFHGVVEDMQMRMMAAAAPPRTSHLPIVLASAAETPPELIMKTRRIGQTGLLVFRHADAPETGGLDQVSPAIRMLGGRDVFTVGARDGRGETLCLTGAMPDRRPLREPERRSWQAVSAHLSAALRLRQRGLRATPEDADVVLDAKGRLLHRDPWSGELRGAFDPSIEELGDRIRALGARQRARDGAWIRALFDGRWSVVRRREASGAIHFVAIRNPVDGVPMRRLTDREREVLCAIVSDDPLKAIAPDLGLTESALARRAASAMKKVGVRSRAELLLVVHALAAISGLEPRLDPSADAIDEVLHFAWRLQDLFAARGLTAAECALVPLLVTGESDARIAAARGSSARTVANQCASLYRKLGVSSRNELACAFVRAFESGRRASAQSRTSGH